MVPPCACFGSAFPLELAAPLGGKLVWFPERSLFSLSCLHPCLAGLSKTHVGLGGKEQLERPKPSSRPWGGTVLAARCVQVATCHLLVTLGLSQAAGTSSGGNRSLLPHTRSWEVLPSPDGALERVESCTGRSLLPEDWLASCSLTLGVPGMLGCKLPTPPDSTCARYCG